MPRLRRLHPAAQRKGRRVPLLQALPPGRDRAALDPRRRARSDAGVASAVSTTPILLRLVEDARPPTRRPGVERLRRANGPRQAWSAASSERGKRRVLRRSRSRTSAWRRPTAGRLGALPIPHTRGVSAAPRRPTPEATAAHARMRQHRATRRPSIGRRAHPQRRRCRGDRGSDRARLVEIVARRRERSRWSVRANWRGDLGCRSTTCTRTPPSWARCGSARGRKHGSASTSTVRALRSRLRRGQTPDERSAGASRRPGRPGAHARRSRRAGSPGTGNACATMSGVGGRLARPSAPCHETAVPAMQPRNSTQVV